MQKFSDSSRMNSQKLKKTSRTSLKTTLKENVKKISIGAVIAVVGISSYAVISSDDSMVSSKSKSVSIAAAGNTWYADNKAEYEEVTTAQVADGTLSEVNKTGAVALSSKKSTRQVTAISGGIQTAPKTEAIEQKVDIPQETEATTEAQTETEATTEVQIEDDDKSAAGLPKDEVSEDPSTEKATDGLPDDKVMYVDGETSGTYLGSYWITAYCPCPICCGEYSNMDNPTTASGAPAVEGVTCAAPSNFDFGTELIVDGHTYTVQDRGGAINGNHLDIYFSNHQAALNFATGYYDVYVK